MPYYPRAFPSLAWLLLCRCVLDAVLDPGETVNTRQYHVFPHGLRPIGRDRLAPNILGSWGYVSDLGYEILFHTLKGYTLHLVHLFICLSACAFRTLHY